MEYNYTLFQIWELWARFLFNKPNFNYEKDPVLDYRWTDLKIVDLDVEGCMLGEDTWINKMCIMLQYFAEQLENDPDPKELKVSKYVKI